MKPWRNPFVVIAAQGLGGAALCLVGAKPLVTACAIGAFPLVEYAVHRFVFHGLWRRLHSAHHRFPDDLTHFAVPPMFSAPAAVVVSVLLGPAFAGGLLLAMTGYDLCHLACHGRAWVPGRALLARHHALHHANEARNFAVSAPMLDRFAGTLAGR